MKCVGGKGGGRESRNIIASVQQKSNIEASMRKNIRTETHSEYIVLNKKER